VKTILVKILQLKTNLLNVNFIENDNLELISIYSSSLLRNSNIVQNISEDKSNPSEYYPCMNNIDEHTMVIKTYY